MTFKHVLVCLAMFSGSTGGFQMESTYGACEFLELADTMAPVNFALNAVEEQCTASRTCTEACADRPSATSDIPLIDVPSLKATK
ncbi:hypothetical protein HBI04_226940 [Parastagonospora nodorum]|nr:hypothetical protein HBI04_226940 [Parastagonospora nodorum]KAH5622292.1 hypothetical protein HBI23_239010 [Parastagonospora nodorum]KAH6483564.1 hypothetical protein HBI55_218410 [Parastagonospora nodorum]